MSFFVVKGWSTDSFYTIKSHSAGLAEEKIFEELSSNINIEILGEFDTEEEAEQFREDEGI